MFETVTVDKALKKGQRMVNYPIASISIIIIVTTIFITVFFNQSGWLIPAGILAAIILGWLYWSLAITKWRIWAFENVRNVHELKQRAIKEKLIWKDGNIFGKTEIRTAAEKEKLRSLESKFLRDDIFIDDYAVPEETAIYYSKKKVFFQILLMLALMGLGIYLLIAGTNYIISGLLVAFGAYFGFSEYKKSLDRSPQIILNSKGVETASMTFYEWKDITNEETVVHNTGKHTVHYFNYDCPEGSEHIDIDEYEINWRELGNLLRVYRGRYSEHHKL